MEGPSYPNIRQSYRLLGSTRLLGVLRKRDRPVRFSVAGLVVVETGHFRVCGELRFAVRRFLGRSIQSSLLCLYLLSVLQC